MALRLFQIVCPFNNYIGITSDGGIYETFVNNTGTSVKGTVVIASIFVANGVDIAPTGSTVPIGVIYESGITNGSLVKVVVYGKAEVLLATDQAATKGYWCGVSNSQQGRMYQLASAPVGSSTHSQEIGHSLETATAGSLSLIQMHFN